MEGTEALSTSIDQTNAINSWLIAITVTLATFMELLDTAIANVSLPHIAGGLATSYDESTWVLASYLVAQRRGVTSERVVEPCVWPQELLHRLGCALQRQFAAVFVGAQLGGWITDSFSWRWVFFINIPIGIVSLILTSRLLSDPPEFKQEVEADRKAGRLMVDYLGILLIALGFAGLEVVLDRGERLDWFESNFIVAFFAIAIVALVAAVIWELRQRDPVVESRLLRERNFALSNAFYFLFGFVLFGSTVLIPQMLQSLYGYTATDAGLVLGPGAMVIVVMAPLIVRMVKRIPVSWMIGFGFTVLGCFVWYFASFNLATNYGREAWARGVGGFGIAFLFIPTSQLAYSYLGKNKNNKASSLTNLFRDQGGSLGIATMADLHRAGRYDRMSDDVHATGQGPLTLQEFVRRNAAKFTASAKAA